jgi:restriction system protein
MIGGVMGFNTAKAFLSGIFQMWYVWAIILGVVAAKIILIIVEKRKLAKSGINDIDTMDGKTFEKYLEVLFGKLGYQVERTKYIGDYGADLVVRRNGVKTVIQAKRHKGKVGVKAIQEAVAAKGFYECHRAMVVTNSTFTNQAKTLASKNRVELWDRKDLVKNLLRIRREGEVAIDKVDQHPLEAANDDSSGECFVCGVPVSPKVRQYCLDHSERFGGKVYCFKHQREDGASRGADRSG